MGNRIVLCNPTLREVQAALRRAGIHRFHATTLAIHFEDGYFAPFFDDFGEIKLLPWDDKDGRSLIVLWPDDQAAGE